MSYIVKDNAKLDEIKAYFALKDELFKNATTFIGDDAKKFVPDIYTEDYSIGVEVVSCEHIASYLHETLILGIGVRNHNKIRKESLEFYNNLRQEYDNLSLKEKQILFNEEFKNRVNKKLAKISNYSGVKKVCLMIVSDNDEKKFIRRDKLVEIYKECIRGKEKIFDELFFYYNQTAYKLVDKHFEKIAEVKEEKTL